MTTRTAPSTQPSHSHGSTRLSDRCGRARRRGGRPGGRHAVDWKTWVVRRLRARAGYQRRLSRIAAMAAGGCARHTGHEHHRARPCWRYSHLLRAAGRVGEAPRQGAQPRVGSAGHRPAETSESDLRWRPTWRMGCLPPARRRVIVAHVDRYDGVLHLGAPGIGVSEGRPECHQAQRNLRSVNEADIFSVITNGSGLVGTRRGSRSRVAPR